LKVNTITAVISTIRAVSISNHSHNTSAIYLESTKPRKCRKQPYWAMQTYFRKN